MSQDAVQNIPDIDIVFLRKEVARYRASLEWVQKQKDTTLEMSVEINGENQKKALASNNIKPEDLHMLKMNLKSLEKLADIDIPRIKKNIDLLEHFTIKTLKNKLNEDNKRSQTKISKMKRNYEDLQKEIDALNSKLAQVRIEANEIRVRLDNEDMEKDNEIRTKIDDRLCECDKDINGERAAEKGPGTDERGKDKPFSLQARKKDIIAAINKMVNQFNENNKMIKDTNKNQKSEQEMNEIIVKNLEIQDACQDIDNSVTEGKLFAKQIDERLNIVLDPTIPEVEAKYDEKNALIDECDELFDKCELKFKELEVDMNTQLEIIDEVVAKLE